MNDLFDAVRLFMYSSRAPVIDGAFGKGASISRIRPASCAALAVGRTKHCYPGIILLEVRKIDKKRINP
jgi:hypothetical protein